MADIESLPKLYIHGVIVESKDEGEVFGNSFATSDCVEFLEQNKEAGEIVVDISSNGGSVSAGKEIYTRLKQSGKKITTVTHKANSIATLLMLAGQKRLIVETADFRPHQARVFGDDLSGMELLADDFFKIGREVESSSEEILNLYCKTLGEDKRTMLLARMAQDINLGAREAIKLGFANGYYKKQTVETENFGGGITITNHLSTLIQNKMADNKDANKDLVKSIEDKIAMGFKSIAKFLTSRTKMFALTLDNDQTMEATPLNPDAPEELMGATIYQTDEAGLPTTNKIEDGPHMTKEGVAFTTVDGVVTEVTPAVDAKKLEEEKKALEDANKALTEKVAALEAANIESVKALDAAKLEMKKEFEGIQMAFNEHKKAVRGDNSDKKEDPQLPKDFSKMTTAQKVRAMSKERAKFEKQ